ncbi:MAG: hypothetical protein HKL80_11995 [Acidimicrobiales bacterium]|nr:hypothetical protein [Acidimicrobiales bacterium]
MSESSISNVYDFIGQMLLGIANVAGWGSMAAGAVPIYVDFLISLKSAAYLLDLACLGIGGGSAVIHSLSELSKAPISFATSVPYTDIWSNLIGAGC